MCAHCSDDRFMPDDYGSRTVADAAAWQRRHAQPADPDRPTEAELLAEYRAQNRREMGLR